MFFIVKFKNDIKKIFNICEFNKFMKYNNLIQI